MNTTNSKLSLLAFVVALLCLVAPSSCDPKQTTDLISRICRQTSDPFFCTITLSGSIKSPTTSLPDLTRITIDVTLSFAQYVIPIIQKLSDNVVRNPAIKQSYQRGRFAYERIVVDLNTAKSFAKTNNFNSVIGPIRAATRRVAESEAIFGNAIVPLREANKIMRVLLNMVALEIK